MKYWKRPDGTCGTLDDNGHVPDSVETNKTTYDSYIEALPKPIPKPDPKIEYEALTNTEDRVLYIARRLKLVD